MTRLGIAVALLAAGCQPGGAFVCELDGECTGGAEGRCEASGDCSFADPGCPSGRRYGEHASGEVAGDCAPGQNLVANPGFEASLAGWVAHDGTLEASEVARSGARSARLCAVDAATGYALGDTPDSVADPAIGEVYRARAWVRTAPGEPAPLVSLLVREPPPEAALESQSAPLALDDTWRLVEVERTIESESTVALLVRGLQGSASCFLVDDVELVLR